MRQTLRFAITLLLFAVTTFAQTGFPPYGSFDNGRFDAVNRQNLNVNIAIPIVSSPGRGFALQFALVHDSKVWQRVEAGSPDLWLPAGNFGWKLDSLVGPITWSQETEYCYPDDIPPRGPSNHLTGFAYTDPSGTVHSFALDFYSSVTDCQFPTGPRTGFASDGSGYYIDATLVTNPKVYSPSGIRITKDEKLTDTNGNFISKSVNGAVTTWKDTVGRNALIIDKTSATQTLYKFLDPAGNYQTITVNWAGFQVTTKFDCSGVTEYSQGVSLPTSVVLPNGQQYSFTYEDSPAVGVNITGRLKRVTLPTGGYYEYTYTGSNGGLNCSDGATLNMTRTIHDGTAGVNWTFARTQVGSDWKTTVTPPTSDISTYTFNSTGQLISEKHYAGAEQSQNLKRTITTTWAANKTPSSSTVALEDNQQSQSETTFDDYGNLTLLKERGFGSGAPGDIVRTTEVSYENGASYTARNIRNRVKQVLVHEGDVTGALKSKTVVAYDETSYSNYNCASEGGAAQHDDAGYGCTFYTRGNPTKVTTYTNAAAGTGAVDRHTKYDMFGNPRFADVNCCQQKEWQYSSTHAYAYPTTIKSGPSGELQASAVYNADTGLVESTTDANGRTTSFTYDVLKRITAVDPPDTGATTPPVTYTYDDDNRTVTVDSPVQGTDKIRRKTYFDTLGRAFMTKVSNSAGANCTASEVEFDDLGRAYKRSNPYECAGSATKWTVTAFDGIGRVTSVTAPAPDSSVTTYEYDGATVTITDPTGKKRKSETDALGRLVKVTEPDVNNNNSLTQYTTYAYNVLDLLTGVTQGAQTRSYTYDDLGRVLSQTTPEAGQWTYEYNPFNLVTKRTDARGVDTNYTYDTLNRLSQVSYDVSGTSVPATATVTYAYGTDTTQNNKGRLVSVTDGVGSETFTYNQLGQITQVAKIISGTTYTTQYGYNFAGEMTSITYPSGRVVAQAYDAVGRLTSLSSGGGSTPYLNTFSYDAATWAVTAFKYGNNAVDATLSYSTDRLQLTALSYKKVGDTNPFFSLTYGYGSAGSNNVQMMSITDTVDSGRTVTYTYDALHRLKTAITNGSTAYPQWGLSWTYDRYGNRSAQTVTHGTGPSNSVTIDANTNRITGSPYAYDANGNMTNDGVNTLAYDAENRVITSSGSQSGAYVYDGVSLRVKKCVPNCTSPTTTTVYVFSGAKVIAEYVNGVAVGSPTREYIYSRSALVATHESGAVKFHYRDHLSTRVTSDSAGANRTEQAHYPFGEQWYNSSGTKLLFTSYERDSESGNDYAIARTYVTRLGRFSRPDTIGGLVNNPQSLNRYAYSSSNPINLVDPLGLEGTGIAMMTESGDLDLKLIKAALWDGPPSCAAQGYAVNCSLRERMLQIAGVRCPGPCEGVAVNSAGNFIFVTLFAGAYISGYFANSDLTSGFHELYNPQTGRWELVRSSGYTSWMITHYPDRIKSQLAASSAALGQIGLPSDLSMNEGFVEGGSFNFQVSASTYNSGVASCGGHRCDNGLHFQSINGSFYVHLDTPGLLAHFVMDVIGGHIIWAIIPR